jgi:hypothetical protein
MDRPVCGEALGVRALGDAGGELQQAAGVGREPKLGSKRPG